MHFFIWSLFFIFHVVSKKNDDGQFLQGLTAVALNSTSIRVFWESPCASIEFLYIILFFNGDKALKHLTTETEYTLTKLKPSSTYNFAVWLLDENGNHFGTAAHTYAKTMSSDALVPKALTAVALNSSSIRVFWEAPCASIAFHYLFTFSNGDEDWKHETMETEYTQIQLKPSSNYKFGVRLLDENGNLFGTPAYTYAKTLPSDRLMPRGLNAMALNSTSIRVSWEPPKASTDLHFLVTFYSGVEHFNLETTETEYTPTELKPSSSFYITLRLLDADEIVVGTTSCTYAKTLPIDGLMPRNLYAVALNSTSIHVSWEPPKASTDLHYLVIFSSGLEVWMHDTKSSVITPADLKPSTNYNFNVWLVDVNGNYFGTPAYTYAKTLPAVISN